MCIRVLYSEQDFVLKVVVNNRLSKKGYQIDVVSEPNLDFLDIDIEKYDMLILSQFESTESTCELLEEVRSVHKTIGLVLVASKLTKAEEIKLYESGADLVLIKPLDIDLFIAKVDSFKRRIELSNYRRTIGDISFNIAQQNLSCEDNSVNLNPTETKLLLKLSDSIGTGIVTNEEITKLLYKEEGFSGSKGTKVYIYRIRNKLKQIKCKRIAIKNHYGMGYYLVVND